MTADNDHNRRTEARGALTRFLPLAVLIAAMIAVVATGAHKELKLENLIARRDDLRAFVATHELQALGLYVLVYVGVVALSVPGAVFVTDLRRLPVRMARRRPGRHPVGDRRVDHRLPDCLDGARRRARAARRAAPAASRRRLSRGRLLLPPVSAPGAAVPALARQSGAGPVRRAPENLRPRHGHRHRAGHLRLRLHGRRSRQRHRGAESRQAGLHRRRRRPTAT